MPLLLSDDPVEFARIKDSMGVTALSTYSFNFYLTCIKYSLIHILLTDENAETKIKLEDDQNNCEKDSLSRTILSLDSAAAKQNALQHVLNALRITLAREIVLAALMSPNIDGKLISLVLTTF